MSAIVPHPRTRRQIRPGGGPPVLYRVQTGTAPTYHPEPMGEPFICDAARTPIGRYGGALSAVRTDDLAAVPIAALLARNPSLEPAAIEEVLLGCANQAGEDNRNIARTDQDRFALRSQQRTAAAYARGFYDAELVPVQIARAKGKTLVTRDEHPRPETTLEQLAGLPTPFRANGTVTAGNASGVNDGAAALLIASEEAARRLNLTPRARILAAATAGVEPRIMGMGPLPATRKVLSLARLTLDELQVIELNEAFASQALAVLRDLKLPDDASHVNPNGGAIALGHPLGMSGARLATTATWQLAAVRGRYALCTMCIGVGQGIALILERP